MAAQQFSKRSSDHERVYAWSVLPLVAVVMSLTVHAWIPGRKTSLKKTFYLSKFISPAANHFLNIPPFVPGWPENAELEGADE